MGDMGVSRVSQKNSDKLLGNLEFTKTFGRNAYGCMEGLSVEYIKRCPGDVGDLKFGRT